MIGIALRSLGNWSGKIKSLEGNLGVEEEEAAKSRHSTKIQTGEPTKSNPEEVSSDLVTRNWLCFVLFGKTRDMLCFLS